MTTKQEFLAELAVILGVGVISIIFSTFFAWFVFEFYKKFEQKFSKKIGEDVEKISLETWEHKDP